MYVFHIRYRNTQGTLMRILNAVSRRGIDMPFVQAEPADQAHKATLQLEVNHKQIGQLCRDWYAIVDVTDVRTGVPMEQIGDRASAWSAETPHPPATAMAPHGAARQASA